MDANEKTSLSVYVLKRKSFLLKQLLLDQEKRGDKVSVSEFGEELIDLALEDRALMARVLARVRAKAQKNQEEKA